MKKTKIICSIGPSTQKWENFKGLVDAGMNVARINFSHATLEERKIDEELVERANKNLVLILLSYLIQKDQILELVHLMEIISI